MKVDWFTVIAQVINFLILVWLLKRFLYKPILNAIDKREKKIRSQLEDAEAKKIEAKREQEEFKQKNDVFDEEKKALLKKAVDESKTAGEMLLEEVRNAADALAIKLKKEAQEIQKNTHRELVQKTQQEVFALSRKVLADLSDISLEEQSVSVFITKLNALNETEKKQFFTSFRSNSNEVFIKSAFKLATKQQDQIKKEIDKLLEVRGKYEFKVNPEVISGIELSANGYKLSWSSSAYINALEKSISATITEDPAIETQ
jgi:F-type H+-transporting ATPase subunit b